MIKITPKYTWAILLFIGIAYFPMIKAQTDVTSSYITNAGFDEDCSYLTGGSATVGSADPGNMVTITGWSIASRPAWSAAGDFEFGWNGTFNGVSIPSTSYDGSTGSGHGTVGFSVGWSGIITYTQQVSLPVGNYGLVVATTIQGADNIFANHTGWVPESGESSLSDLTTVSTSGQWVLDTIRFKTYETTTGVIQVGMQAYGSTSTANGRLFIDYVQLLELEADKTDLEALLATASDMLANQQPIPDGSTAYTDLSAAITAAQTVFDNEAATTVEVIQAEKDLTEAISNVEAAIYLYDLLGANLENPINITEKIVNPDFEANGGSTDGWISSFGVFSGSNAVFDGAPSPNHVMDGDPNSSTINYQTISGIPAGAYKVDAIARGRVESSAKMFIGAQPGNTLTSTTIANVEVNRIGDVGGTLNYGFNPYQTPYVVVPEGSTSVSIGIYFEGDCGWSSVDNFELTYYGSTTALAEALKTELTALKDSSDLPESFDTSEAETLLATDLTSENEAELTIQLESTINSLKEVIAQNIDASLADLQVDGTTIRDFDAETLEYTYNIYSSTVQTPDVPVVTATKNSSYAADPVITPTAQVPGTTQVTVTAGNGSEITYSIHFEFVQLSSLENYTATVETFQNQSVEISGNGQLTITGNANPLSGSAINLVSTDAWIYFASLRPSEVINSELTYITVNGEVAEHGVNVRVAPYLNGAMVIPHSTSYAALTVYSNQSIGGSSMDFVSGYHYTGSQLGDLDNDIESFVLKKGYMATFATNTNGTGKSRVYIADDYDVTINMMPEGLDNSVSFIVVRPWRWTVKKGWRGSSAGADRFNAGSHYDYNNGAYSTVDVEYVPMRHNPNWNAYSNFYDKYSSTSALGYNEPDNSVDDGYSTVEGAIASWPNMMESGLRLGSPAVTDGGLSWLADFMAQAEALDYRVDFIAWHFYRAGYTAKGYYDALKSIYDTYKRPIWITEFNNGCNWTYNGNIPSIEENGRVIEEFINMLDTTSFVERYYVWDGCNEELRMTNSGTGELYPAGEAYQNLVSTMSYTADFYNDQDIAKIEENAKGFCSIDGTIENGYANTTDATGSGIDYKVIYKTNGLKTINIVYASTEATTANVIVNDVVVVEDLEFSASGSLDYNQIASLSFSAEPGIADIRIEAATSAGLPNIDYIEITDGTPADCEASYPVILSYTNEQTGNYASNILDGSTATRWSAQYFPQSLVIDYGEIKSIIGTKVYTYSNRDYQYTIELDDDVNFSDPFIVDRTDNTTTSQPISDAFNAVNARYARLTVTGVGNSYSGDWISITELQIEEGTSTAIGDVEISSNGVSIYPNPAKNYFNVSIENSLDEALLYIYNNSGQLIKRATILNAEGVINCSDLTSGIYLIKVVSDNKTVTQKLIIE